MLILEGLRNGAVLQRDNEGFCQCLFKAEADGKLHSTLGEIKNIGNREYMLYGIPTGGPYDIEIFDNTDKLAFTVWVGDLWILAGQSNMEGAGCVTERTENEPVFDSVRCYYLDTRWDAARPVTHEPWLSPDGCIGGWWRKQRLESDWGVETPDSYKGQKVKKRAVGPGYYFAKKMYEITKVPQAVIPCALGGSSLELWKKRNDTDDCLYNVMIRRFKECGANVRGIYWDQGESEVGRDDTFDNSMIELVSNVRKDMNNTSLPFVQTQIARCALSVPEPGFGIDWSKIKEKQRLLDDKIEFLTTISAIDADYDDLIHYSSEFQEKMGTRAANAMANIIGVGGVAVPKVSSITYRKNEEYSPFLYIYDIHYQNVENLTSTGYPSGFMVVPKDYDLKKVFNSHMGVQKIKISGNVISLYSEIKENPEDVSIYYGFGHMAYCNIETDKGFAIPAMGPVSPKCN